MLNSWKNLVVYMYVCMYGWMDGCRYVVCMYVCMYVVYVCTYVVCVYVYGMYVYTVCTIIICTSSSPCSFKWYRDTEELEYCKTAKLVVPRASYSDSGQYCCSVSNQHGSKLSKSFHVQVSRVKGEQHALRTSVHIWGGWALNPHTYIGTYSPIPRLLCDFWNWQCAL